MLFRYRGGVSISVDGSEYDAGADCFVWEEFGEWAQLLFGRQDGGGGEERGGGYFAESVAECLSGGV